MTIKTEHDIVDLRRQAMGYGVLAAWSGAGLLDALADGNPRQLSELPGDPRAIENTAPVLASMGLLSIGSGGYALSRVAQQLLEQGALDLGGSDAVLGDLSRLDGVMRQGGPVLDSEGREMLTEGGVRLEDKAAVRGFLGMLYRRSAPDVGEVARWFTKRLPEESHLLDLGGGHGRYGAEMVDHGMTCTLLDRKPCVEVAKERYGDKLNYYVANFMEDSLGGPYDGAILSNIIHCFGEAENRLFMKRLYDSLRPGAVVCIKDMFLDRSQGYPPSAAYFGVIMLSYTRTGRCFVQSEYEALCLDVGYASVESVYVADRGYTLMFLTR